MNLEDELISRLSLSGDLYVDNSEESSFQLLRPQEIAEDPAYFVEEAVSIVEGEDDVCLLGAMAALWGHSELLIENLFGSEADDFKTYGLYTCRFYLDGEWQEVVSDTRLPCYEGVPIIGHCRNLREQWVGLLGKAYAKLFRGTSRRQSTLAEALVELSGGSAEQLQIGEDQSYWWEYLKKRRDDVVCCTSSDGASVGLVPDHAYCVVATRQIGSYKFVQLRNPWADKGDWIGPWSKRSTEWDDYFPQIHQKNLENDDQTSFYVTMDDFCKYFDEIYVCRIFPDNKFKQYKIRGRWHSQQQQQHQTESSFTSPAGSPPPAPAPQTTTVDDRYQDRVRNDDDPNWFKNPQYRLYSPKLLRDVHLSLFSTVYRGGFDVVRTKKATIERVFSKDQVQLVETRTKLEAFETCATISMEPDFFYFVVVHASERGDFVLRTFSPDDIKVQIIPESHVQTIPGAWSLDDNTAGGGPFEGDGHLNANWCLNPQFLLKTRPNDNERGVDVKIVLRRTDDESASIDQVPCGLVACFTNSEDVQSKQPEKNALGFPKPSKPSTLKKKRRNGSLERRRHEEEENRVRLPRRKRALLEDDENDWWTTSRFESTAVATLFLPSPGRDLLVVPSLATFQQEGTFLLEVHTTEKAIEIQANDERRNKTVVGEWNESNAGGNHLHATWKKNPRFKLAFFGRRPVAKVAIVVSRRRRRFSNGEDDSVDSMIGFYLTRERSILMSNASHRSPSTEDSSSDMIFYQGKPWNESPFVPLDEVSTPPDFSLDNGTFTIMPATYAPGKYGQFYLSVSSDADFTLTPSTT